MCWDGARYATNPKGLTPCASTLQATACPRYYILYRRLMWFRRMLAKGTNEDREILTNLIQLYASQEQPGTHLREEGLFTLMIRGGTLAQGHWKWRQRPHGPVGLLLQTLHEVGAALTQDLYVQSHYSPDPA